LDGFALWLVPAFGIFVGIAFAEVGLRILELLLELVFLFCIDV
jgi:hypothetical protein